MTQVLGMGPSNKYATSRALIRRYGCAHCPRCFQIPRGGNCSSPTLLLHRDAHVLRALRELAETGLSPIASRALSLSRMVEGREAPGASEYESLIGLIASARDGYTIFPHPLALPSATWVGSRGVEDALRRLVFDACDRFAKRVPKQLGLDEEQHTRDLLRDLEDSLGRLADSPWIVRSNTAPATPEIIIDYRQESKHAEHGTSVDVAFLVDIDIPGVLRLTSAELVKAAIKRLPGRAPAPGGSTGHPTDVGAGRRGRARAA